MLIIPLENCERRLSDKFSNVNIRPGSPWNTVQERNIVVNLHLLAPPPPSLPACSDVYPPPLPRRRLQSTLRQDRSGEFGMSRSGGVFLDPW